MRSRLTLTDTLCTIAVLALVFGGAVVPSVVRSRESSNRIKCASNLRQIGLYLQMYAIDDVVHHAYPRAVYVPGAPPTAYTAPFLASAFAANGPGPNDVTAAIWVLLRASDMTPETLICPVSNAQPFQGDVQMRSNFESQVNLSYGLSNPYPDDSAVKAGFKWDQTTNPEMVLAADLAPAGPAKGAVKLGDTSAKMRLANSPNHGEDGQNVLFGDGHVEFAQSPFVGAMQENIYAVNTLTNGVIARAGINGSPGFQFDAVVMPEWNPATRMPGRPTAFLGGIFQNPAVIAITVLLLAAAAFIAYVFWQFRRRGPVKIDDTLPPA